jgi:hypothetical protein
LGWAYFGPHQPFPYINALPLWPMMTHPIPQSLPAIRPFIDMPACGVQRRKQGRSYAPRHPHCAPKEATRPCAAKRSPRSSLSSKNPRKYRLGRGFGNLFDSQMGRRPIKKRLGYREAALMGLS